LSYFHERLLNKQHIKMINTQRKTIGSVPGEKPQSIYQRNFTEMNYKRDHTVISNLFTYTDISLPGKVEDIVVNTVQSTCCSSGSLQNIYTDDSSVPIIIYDYDETVYFTFYFIMCITVILIIWFYIY